jgi:hypothetical protein
MVVQPQAVLVPLQLKDVRIAVAVGYVHCAIRATARLIRKEEVGLYFIREHDSASATHQVVSFC